MNTYLEVRTSAHRTHSEGKLVVPPQLVQDHLEENQSKTLPFWASQSPASDPTHELSELRTAWRELVEIIASSHVPEVPEVFQMPPVPTTRVHARIRHVGPAPFVFIDELAE